MNKPIYVVGGSKGGVGKSLVSMAMTHFLTEAREKVFLIDADTSNPDVFKSYGAEVQCELVNLDDADGWIRFVNICDENKDAAVVVNTAARNNQGVAAYGATLSKSLEELDGTLVTLWVINRQRDSLELLKDYIEAIPDSTSMWSRTAISAPTPNSSCSTIRRSGRRSRLMGACRFCFRTWPIGCRTISTATG